MSALLDQREDGGWLVGGGEMGERIRAKDWSTTSLGPIDGWPAELRNAIGLVLASLLPSNLTWGDKRIQLYNDAFRPFLAHRHPGALGQGFDECWHPSFPGTGLPLRRTSSASLDENQRLFLERDGHLEETFHTHAVSPVRAEHGDIGGHLHQLIDVTAQALAARRLRALRALAQDTAQAETLEQCLTLAARALAAGDADLPFLLFYAVDQDGTSARLVAQTGLGAGGTEQPTQLDLAATAVWPLGPALATRRPLRVPDVQARFPGLTGGPYPEPIAAAFVLPIGAGTSGKALVVAGVSQRVPLNDAYIAFYELLATGLGNAVAVVTAAAAERRHATVANELADANKELDAFSYSVSHDLRTPLRAIDGFSRALLSEQTGKLDDQGRHYLERIRSATQHMAALIDDLLSLSRITRATLRRERVDLSVISRKVLSDLAARDSERRVDVAVTEGLVASADPRLIRALCENLLGNAWKFSAKQPEARIEVTSESRDGDTIFVVQDNGAGFNMDYAKKLFEPFQRLHAASEFQGTGIGLATVHRIVTRHGGRIWAQSAPSQGATFYFTLGEPS